jgi:hypothetical protein
MLVLVRIFLSERNILPVGSWPRPLPLATSLRGFDHEPVSSSSDLTTRVTDSIWSQKDGVCVRINGSNSTKPSPILTIFFFHSFSTKGVSHNTCNRWVFPAFQIFLIRLYHWLSRQMASGQLNLEQALDPIKIAISL